MSFDSKDDGGQRLLAQFQSLLTTLHQRSQNFDSAKTSSYTATLIHGKADSLLKKIVEEAAEAALAAKAENRQALTCELADLWFHCLIVMTRYNITMVDIAAVLEERQGIGGFVEKDNRQ